MRARSKPCPRCIPVVFPLYPCCPCCPLCARSILILVVLPLSAPIVGQRCKITTSLPCQRNMHCSPILQVLFAGHITQLTHPLVCPNHWSLHGHLHTPQWWNKTCTFSPESLGFGSLVSGPCWGMFGAPHPIKVGGLRPPDRPGNP